MFDISEYVEKANAKTGYFQVDEIAKLSSYVKSGLLRTETAAALTTHQEEIIKEAVARLIQKRPEIIAPVSNEQSESILAVFVRDLDFFLRLITYAIIAENILLLDDLLVKWKQLGEPSITPVTTAVQGIQEMKDVISSILSSDKYSEAFPYFEHIVKRLSSQNLLITDEIRSKSHHAIEYPDPEVLDYMEKQEILFTQHKPELLEKYPGMYVLFEDGKVLDCDTDEEALVLRAYEHTGPRPLFVKKVLEEEPQYMLWNSIYSSCA
ncbi:MAG: hypothetical protein VKJ46_02460 [Leptolyngbyaceae bacterium]|nr:hypothetical protein [Leptolyngbyaceae bacterium]